MLFHVPFSQTVKSERLSRVACSSFYRLRPALIGCVPLSANASQEDEERSEPPPSSVVASLASGRGGVTESPRPLGLGWDVVLTVGRSQERSDSAVLIGRRPAQFFSHQLGHTRGEDRPAIGKLLSEPRPPREEVVD